jgi:O-antigen ligase
MAVARRTPPGDPLGWAAAVLTTLAVAALGTVSPELLALFKVHYISSGGNFLEKIHPATYLTVAAFMLLLLRRGDPIGEFDRIVSDAKLVLVFLYTCGLLLFQSIALNRPITGIADAFLLPALLSFIIWNVAPAQRRPMALAIHFVIWINIALAFHEYFSHRRLIPITLGNQIVLGDWRATALLGHPGSAGAAVAIYIMALLLRSRDQQTSALAVPAILIAVTSLMAFGARTALVAVGVVFAGAAAWNFFRLIRGDRFGLVAAAVTIVGLLVVGAAVAMVLDSGLFDRMLSRFGNDSGSAHARIASLHLLSYLDWKELLLGTETVRANALQSSQGLAYGIEDFWIACIVQYGIIQTVVITAGLGCFFAEVVKHTSPGARVVVLFICVVAASSVSFSAKNISLARDVAILLLLLPRQRAKQVKPQLEAWLPYGGISNRRVIGTLTR